MKKYIPLSLLCIWILGFCIFTYKINSLHPDHTKETDAIIVLTGGRNRIAEASKLYNNGIAKHMFISGVAKDISLQNIQKTQNINFKKIHSIEIGHNADNTVENAKETKDWIEKNNIKSIRLVTSNYHLYRSLIEFNKQIKDINIIPHPVFSEYIEKKWWTSWQTFSLIFKEYNKLLCAYIISKF